jgi:hypothetical protein
VSAVRRPGAPVEHDRWQVRPQQVESHAHLRHGATALPRCIPWRKRNSPARTEEPLYGERPALAPRREPDGSAPSSTGWSRARARRRSSARAAGPAAAWWPPARRGWRPPARGRGRPRGRRVRTTSPSCRGRARPLGRLRGLGRWIHPRRADRVMLGVLPHRHRPRATTPRHSRDGEGQRGATSRTGASTGSSAELRKGKRGGAATPSSRKSSAARSAASGSLRPVELASLAFVSRHRAAS